MSRHASLIILAGLLVATTGCNLLGPRGTDWSSRGAPERLLDVSSEVVNLGVKSGKEVDDLSQWVNRDQPTRAELYCAEGELNCREAKQVLDLYGVPTLMVPSNAGTVTLVYERVLARDCDQRFVDAQDLWYNEHHPAFGCSISANIVQHVTQKQQFVSPNLSDFRDAEAATGSYNRYQQTVGQSINTNAGQYSIRESSVEK
jgi:hypothetical protein